MLQHLSTQVGPLRSLVLGTMFITGILFSFVGILKLKHFGHIRTMMTSAAELKGPLLYLFVGAVFIYYPTSLNMTLSTFFGTATIQPYTGPHEWHHTKLLLKSLGMIIQLVGYIAFFRGWILLARLSGQTQPGTFAKAFWHIIGGILAINIFATWSILENSVLGGGKLF
jgi:intracellular multiplication protein IcmC